MNILDKLLNRCPRQLLYESHSYVYEVSVKPIRCYKHILCPAHLYNHFDVETMKEMKITNDKPVTSNDIGRITVTANDISAIPINDTLQIVYAGEFGNNSVTIGGKHTFRRNDNIFRRLTKK